MTYGRTDNNHGPLIDCFRKLGCTVEPRLAQLGQGAPDLLCAIDGMNFLVEVKNFFLPPSRRRLTPDEKKYHAAWRGRIHLIETEQQAMDLVKHYRRMAKILVASIFLPGPGDTTSSLPQQKNNPEITRCL